MQETILSIPGEISKVESKPNGAFRLWVDSQESIPPEQRAKVFNTLDKPGYFCFLPEMRPIAADEVVGLPPLKLQEDETMTPAQKLRWLIGKLAKQKGERDAETFYRRVMQRFCDQISEKLT